MQTLFLILCVLLLAGILLARYFWTHRRVDGDLETPSYLKRYSLLQQHEQNYFKALSKVIGRNAYIFPKVRLSELIRPQGTGTQAVQRAHWSRVQRRCVDFLLCSPNSLAPVLAIDLDNKSKKRKREHSKGGGDILAESLMAASIPLLRVRAAREYDDDVVLNQIRLALAKSQETIPESFSVKTKRRNKGWRLPFDFRRLVQKNLPTFGRMTSNLWGALRRA